MIQKLKCLVGKHKWGAYGYIDYSDDKDFVDVTAVKCEYCGKVKSSTTRISVYDLKPPFGKAK